MSNPAPPAAASDESDLAYLKRLAAAGRGEPAPFLLLMAVFGGAYGFVMLAIWLGLVVEGIPQAVNGRVEAGPIVQTLNLGIFAAHIAFLAALIWTAWRTLGPNRVRLSRAATATWSAAFIAMVTTVVSFRVFSQELPTDAVYAAYMMPPVLLMLWGCAWWVTAILNDRRWLLLVAVGSFAAAVALSVIGNAPALLPAACACLLLLAFLPAVILMRQRPR